MPLSVSRLVHFRRRRVTKSKKKKHPWFKRKGYLHFDLALERAEAETYVTNPENIVRHRFSPLIHYGKISRKVERNKKAEKLYKQGLGPKPELLVHEKSRNIFYTSHVDGYIYSYYTYTIQKAYEAFLIKNNLAENAIAYRPISKNGIKFCNSHLADEAFQFIRSSGGCNVLCFDISKFFDKLDVEILRSKWAQVLGENRLPDDHFSVYKSMVNFRYVEEGHLIENFKGKFGKNPRQHGLSRESGGSRKNRICDYTQLRAVNEKFKKNKKHLLKKKEMADMTGIPQGTAMSGLLSNIFMIDFDLAVKKFVEGKGGCYRRYSDDIFIAVPASENVEQVKDFIRKQLTDCCTSNKPSDEKNHIKLNEKKTEEKIYRASAQGFEIVNRDGKPSKVQYLGFHFDGENVFIRTSSISKDRGKIIQGLRKNKKGKGKIDTNAVFKERSSRKITPYDKKKAKGFAYYAERSAKAHGGSETIKKQIKKNDRFIKRAGKRELLRGSNNK